MRAVLNSRDVRRAMRRLVAACLAVAMFAASGGAVLLGQVCTHHGGVADAHVEITEVAAVEASHAGHHAPATAATDVAPDAQSDESHDDGECTCLGACQTAGTIVAGSVDSDVVRVPAPQYVLIVATPSFDLVPRASQATWFLPPGNGPPAHT